MSSFLTSRWVLALNFQKYNFSVKLRSNFKAHLGIKDVKSVITFRIQRDAPAGKVDEPVQEVFVVRGSERQADGPDGIRKLNKSV